MKEYKSATNDIHAPKDLIERTKASVREEEKRVEKSRRKLITVSKGLTVAAAVIVAAIIAVPAVRTGILRNENTELGAGWQGRNDTQIMFGTGTVEEEPGKIGKERSIIKQGSIHDEYPEAIFIEQCEVKGITVSVYDIEAENEDGVKFKENEPVIIHAAAEFNAAGETYYAVSKDADTNRLLGDVEEFIGGITE